MSTQFRQPFGAVAIEGLSTVNVVLGARDGLAATVVRVSTDSQAAAWLVH